LLVTATMVKSHQPYVTSGNNKNNQQQQSNNSNSYSNTGTPGTYNYNTNVTSSAYAPAGAYSTSSNYASQPTTTTSAYAPAGSYTSSTRATTTTATTQLPDFSQALNVPPPTVNATYSTPSTPSTYGVPSTSATSPYGSTSTSTSNRAPGFAPNAATVSSLASKLQTMYTSAVATPVNNTGGMPSGVVPAGPMSSGTYTGAYYGGDSKLPGGGGVFAATSALNSSTYTGGPTGGLISEGNPTICQKIDYEIKGHEMQLVEIELDPSETVIAEAGALMYLEDGIDFKTKFGDGSTPKEGFFKKLLSAGGRLLMGESLFITHFTNQGHKKARVAFAAPFPGSILPINLQNLGGKIICEKDAFLCAAKGTKLSIHFNKKFGSGLFGGEGFILQKLEGDGMAFIHAGGMVIRRELRGEKLRIDTGCVVAFTDGINFDIQFVPGLKSMFFGGEGLFLATLQGTGTVWLQSLPFSRFCDRVVQHAPSIGGRRQGEGSLLTGRVGDVVNGDGFGFKF